MCAGANTDKKAQSLDQRECLDHLATEGQQVKLSAALAMDEAAVALTGPCAVESDLAAPGQTEVARSRASLLRRVVRAATTRRGSAECFARGPARSAGRAVVTLSVPAAVATPPSLLLPVGVVWAQTFPPA